MEIERPSSVFDCENAHVNILHEEQGAHTHVIITNYDCEIVSEPSNKKFEVVLDKLEELDHETTDDECDEDICTPSQKSWLGIESPQFQELSTSTRHFPTPPILPTYCKTVLYCADFPVSSPLASPLTKSLSLGSAYDFCEAGCPLGGLQRVDTLLGRRVKIIGLHSDQAALEYNLSTRMIDDAVLQRFEAEISEATRTALHDADVWVIQRSLAQEPVHKIKLWIRVFLFDRSRPKRLIYDVNPQQESRDMRPQKLLSGVSNWQMSSDKHHTCGQPSPASSHLFMCGGEETCMHRYVIDFTRTPRVSSKLR